MVGTGTARTVAGFTGGVSRGDMSRCPEGRGPRDCGRWYILARVETRRELAEKLAANAGIFKRPPGSAREVRT
jgi:hypothetical protein